MDSSNSKIGQLNYAENGSTVNVYNYPILEHVLSKSVPSEPLTLSSAIPPAIDLIGRDNDIQDIRDLLKQHNIVSIHADGGVGKTAIAVKIANQIKKDVMSGKSKYQHCRKHF